MSPQEVKDLLRDLGMDEDWEAKGAKVTGWRLDDE
jgi:hypothetical protein